MFAQTSVVAPSLESDISDEFALVFVDDSTYEFVGGGNSANNL